jgi:hypothetical protein
MSGPSSNNGWNAIGGLLFSAPAPTKGARPMQDRLTPQTRSALIAYAQIEREVVGVGLRTDPGRKLELVKLRRALARQLGEVGIALEQDLALGAYPDQKRQMIDLFCAFRYALAHHLANFPAVGIDIDRSAYARSAQQTFGKSECFWKWCMENVDFRRI